MDASVGRERGDVQRHDKDEQDDCRQDSHQDTPVLDDKPDDRLKQGYWNHGAFCLGVLEVRESQVRSRLYEGPGFPLLEVLVEDVLAHRTADLFADVATQARLPGKMGSIPGLLSEGATVGA